MARISKETEYAIKYLTEHKKLTPQEVAKELGIKINTVNKLINKTDDQKISPAKTDKTKNLMIRQTSAKKTNTVSIMTEAAAQLNDEFIKTMNNSTKNTSKYIFKPKG